MVNPSSPVPFAFETSSYSHFLGNEQTETAMICWLQKQGRDTVSIGHMIIVVFSLYFQLPDSLFVTASVLFGWVDSHDLMALLDVSLREVATQLEKETDFCIISCSQGRCWLEDRMHRAQTEISLFSTAIANLCEELELRNSPSEQRLADFFRCSIFGLRLPKEAHSGRYRACENIFIAWPGRFQ